MVSIIVTCHNGIQHTVKCVESILAFTKNFELIIVDNGSSDGTSGYLNNLADKHDNIHVIFNKENQTFSHGNNQGIKKATGQYICFLNNDTIVNEFWMDRLMNHINHIPLKNIGMIGPVSSMSNGAQMVGKQDPMEWFKKEQGRWMMTGCLYGWCVLAKREVIDKIGGFDERFVNSYEDNDLSLRALLAGYKLAIAYDTYIDHVGQGTIRTQMDMKKYIQNGEENRKRYFDKYYTPEKKKLVAVYRTNGGKWLEESLKQTSKFADSIVIHFCRAPKEYSVSYNSSRDGYMKYLCAKFPKIVHIEWYDGIFQEDYERGRLLEIALAMQAKGEADWCISIDDDEIYEDAFIDRVQGMINPYDPEILAYWCQWRTIWSRQMGKEYYRTDDTFGGFSNYRLWKLIPGQEIVHEHIEGHHCGSAPMIAPGNIKWSKVRVKHLGYDTPEQRQTKFEFYQANDHFKTKKDIGHDDYSHLIDINVSLEEYRENNGLSLVMMVKNEEDMILGCLENIEPLVDEIVIVDTGSTDRTKSIIQNFAVRTTVPVKLLDYPWEDNYSTPRNFGKRHATKEWILVMDADERFEFGDMNELFRMTEMQADGFIFHVLNYIEPHLDHTKPPKCVSSENLRLFRNIPEFFYTGIIHETLDDASSALARKRRAKIFRCRIPLHHHGYLKSKEKVQAKLAYYETLNNKQVDVTEGKDPRPYFNLAMHYLQEDKRMEALQAFTTALKINPDFWHASQQMAALNISSAKDFLRNMIVTMPVAHPFKTQAEEILRYLDERTFGFAKVGQ